MHEEPTLADIQKKWHGTLQSYIIGFVVCILLTATAFILVGVGLKGTGVIFSVIGLGVMQAIAQLLFFLHVGQEDKPRWETLIFSFMVMVLIIVAVGTLWIMHDLHQRVMQPSTEMVHD